MQITEDELKVLVTEAGSNTINGVKKEIYCAYGPEFCILDNRKENNWAIARIKELRKLEE